MTAPRAAAVRLAEAPSPYLRGHAGDPVEWFPWGDEAFARARELDRPIFLVIGFETCRWCHAMARESFRDPAVAALLNQRFVNVLVDRQERPEIDEIYMAAAQILNQQGGWPTTLFLTPELRPFFTGTYFPPDDRPDRPGIRTVIDSLHHAWTQRRADAEAQADELVPVMDRFLGGGFVGPLPSAEVAAETALDSLYQRYDAEHGGFGGPGKFHSPASLELLLELAPTKADVAAMLDHTLDAMARGGVYDQLGGGFHRCALDPAWRRPQFEKMLAENGLLLELYARRLKAQPRTSYRRVVKGTAAFLLRELTLPEGGFAAGLSGEHRGVDGAYYRFTPAEIEKELGTENTSFLAPLLGFGRGGEEGVLYRPQPLAAEAARRRLSEEVLRAELEPLEAQLLQAREQRPKPYRDTMLLAGWNGLAIGGLAAAGDVLGDKDLIAAAARVTEEVLALLRPEGQLFHCAFEGTLGSAALLEDYVFLVRGLLRLHRGSGEAAWLQLARELAEEQHQHLAADGSYASSAPRDDLLCRSRPLFDGMLPATSAVAVWNHLDLAQLDPVGPWLERAESALVAHGDAAVAQANSARAFCLAIWRYHFRDRVA